MPLLISVSLLYFWTILWTHILGTDRKEERGWEKSTATLATVVTPADSRDPLNWVTVD